MSLKKQYLDELNPADLLEMRSHSLLFLKLDIGYLFAAGALAATLQITRSEFFNLIPIWMGPGIALALVAAFDAFVFGALSQGWVYAKTGIGRRYGQSAIPRLLNFQIVWHTMFFFALIGFFSGYITSRQMNLAELRHQISLQESVESYIEKFGKTPSSAHDLSVESPPSARKAINALKEQGLKIESFANGQYKITLGGRDGVLGTDDDDVITPEFKLKSILEKMESFI